VKVIFFKYEFFVPFQFVDEINNNDSFRERKRRSIKDKNIMIFLIVKILDIQIYIFNSSHEKKWIEILTHFTVFEVANDLEILILGLKIQVTASALIFFIFFLSLMIILLNSQNTISSLKWSTRMQQNKKQ
jgi:hypothetical protein